MISKDDRIQLTNKAEFEKSAKDLIDKVFEARNEKKSAHELSKLVKDASFQLIDKCVDLEDIEHLVGEAKRLKVKAKDDNLMLLSELLKDGAALRTKIRAKVGNGLNKTNAREYILSMMKLRVSYIKTNQF